MKLTAQEARQTVEKLIAEDAAKKKASKVTSAKAAELDKSDLALFEKLITQAITAKTTKLKVKTLIATSQNVVDTLRAKGFTVSRQVVNAPYNSLLKSLGLSNYEYNITW